MSGPSLATKTMLGVPSVLTPRASTWIVTGSALGLMFGFGPLFFSVVTIFLKPIAATFGWGRADVAVLPMFALMGTALGGPVVGYLADRIGWSKVIAGSIVLLAMMLGALAIAPANHLYFAAVGFMIGFLGSGTTPAGYLGVLPQLFYRRLGTALGLAMVGTGLGGILAPIAANRIGSMMDWRYWYALCGLIVLVFGFAAHRILFQNIPRKEPAGAYPHGTAASIEVEGLTFREAVRGYRFWLLAAVMFTMSCATIGGYVHLAPFISDQGLGHAVGATAASVVGVGIALSRVGLGALLDWVFAPLVSFVCFCVGAAGFAVFLTDAAHIPAMLIFASFMLGISMGSEGDLIPYLARRYFGRRAFGSIYGALFGAGTLGGAAGPFLYGIAFDRLGSYTIVHEVALVACLIGAAAPLLLGRYPAAQATDK